MSSIKTRKRVFDYKSLSDFGRTEEKVIKKFKGHAEQDENDEHLKIYDDDDVDTNGVYKVERAVAKRKNVWKGRVTEYLVLWRGYPTEDAQWVPSVNLTEEVVRSYNAPTPSSDIIQDNVGRLTLEIDKSLRKGSSKDFNVHVIFRHDVYRHLFGDKTILCRSDFNSQYFKEGWDQCYKDYDSTDEHNHGLELLYPIHCRLYLDRMKKGHCRKGDGTMNYKSRGFVEKVTFTIKKKNC